MKKPRIIFVDDEPNILAGMNRMMRSLRKGLEFSFTESGKEALKMMAEKPYDIIVSDMRMPGMDGIELLTMVRELYPDTIRIMLSGQANNESILQSVPVAHQFIAKPCEPERLKEILHRSCQLYYLINREPMREIITKLDTLPSLPAIYLEIQQILKNPMCTVNQVADCITKDLSMSAKMMQMVNSSFFGIYENIESPSQAVHLLGLDTVKNLVMNIHIFSQFNQVNDSIFSIEKLWFHSIAVAGCAKKIVEHENGNKQQANHAFLAGLMHDIGQLILCTNFPNLTKKIMAMAEKENLEIYQAENKILEVSHGEIGAYLLGLWGFDNDVVQAVAFHHRPHKYACDEFSILTAVHIADCYAISPSFKNGSKLSTEHLIKIKMEDKLNQWQEICNSMEEKPNA